METAVANSRTPIVFAVLALLAATTTLGGGHARAQVDVDVAIDNLGGSRVLHVEDLAGRDLSALDFGSARSLPFRVRVVDTTMDRTGFQVSASMTKLYHDAGGLDFATAIASTNASVQPVASDPLNVLDPSARVQPVFDTVSTITDSTICTLLALLFVDGACTIELAEIEGFVQDVGLDVDLSDLTGLPLLPQVPESGAFTNPSFEGVASDDPTKSGAPAATSRRLVAGSTIATPAVLTNVQNALTDVLAGLAIRDTVDQDVLTAALRDTVGAVWDLLSTAQVETVVDSTAATLRAVTGDDLLAQSGTYLSFPRVDITIPAEMPAGTYRGTLVVTGLE